ncbi:MULTISPECIES: amino acid ABC transporter permease [unclassified Lonepinella]|uniref:amino acid ABC transporter permease n=1 Tax=unclassified Lonepinella TaxID=2642006 RepID=UPI003F6DE37F
MEEFSRIYELCLTSIPIMADAMVKVTIPLSIISFAIGLVIALFTALIQVAKVNVFTQLCQFYIWIFRGTPLLVQLFIVYFGLPIIGISLDVWAAAIITFSLNIGAFASETVRAAILSVSKGQWESATSLGLSYPQIVSYVVLPQAVRIALPSLSNTFISTVKETSLVASITMVDMFMAAQRIAARVFDPLTLYVLAALMYLLVCTLLTYGQARLEKYSSRFV